ncbi:hypothetical protein DSO57_1023200 [Entomophthora muscae]|uniref:Uncharacterized protein n=1 Tax=Entomophthora muscae TaxID=34485 RepID=A0ACC2U1A1_9FUNG|nr:hypothetical protein DSO57_1023200 [Entomophthora muscae]
MKNFEACKAANPAALSALKEGLRASLIDRVHDIIGCNGALPSVKNIVPDAMEGDAPANSDKIPLDLTQATSESETSAPASISETTPVLVTEPAPVTEFAPASLAATPLSQESFSDSLMCNFSNSMLESPLRIIYLNVCALRTDKLERLLNLYANTYNLIFLSETWFIDFAKMQNHPDFIIHTHIANLQTCTHQQAGIACFFHHFCSNICRACVTIYAVIIEITTLKMVGTYIPSSAPIEIFATTLNACPGVNLLFGDINVEFGPS